MWRLKLRPKKEATSKVSLQNFQRQGVNNNLVAVLISCLGFNVEARQDGATDEPFGEFRDQPDLSFTECAKIPKSLASQKDKTKKTSVTLKWNIPGLYLIIKCNFNTGFETFISYSKCSIWINNIV